MAAEKHPAIELAKLARMQLNCFYEKNNWWKENNATIPQFTTADIYYSYYVLLLLLPLLLLIFLVLLVELCKQVDTSWSLCQRLAKTDIGCNTIWTKIKNGGVSGCSFCFQNHCLRFLICFTTTPYSRVIAYWRSFVYMEHGPHAHGKHGLFFQLFKDANFNEWVTVAACKMLTLNVQIQSSSAWAIKPTTNPHMYIFDTKHFPF